MTRSGALAMLERIFRVFNRPTRKRFAHICAACGSAFILLSVLIMPLSALAATVPPGIAGGSGNTPLEQAAPQTPPPATTNVDASGAVDVVKKRFGAWKTSSTEQGSQSEAEDPPYTEEWRPRVAASPTNFLVVWEHYDDLEGVNIYGARVSSAGGVLDGTPLKIASGKEWELSPDVAWSGGAFVVGWQNWFSGKVRARIVPPVGDPATNAFDIAASSDDRHPISIASAGASTSDSKVLVTWTRSVSRGFVDDYDVFGSLVRLNTSGSLAGISPPVSLTPGESNSYAAHAAWNGTRFLVSWTDDRQAPGLNGPFVFYEHGDIFGALLSISPSGTLAPGAPFPISKRQGGPQIMSHVAAKPQGDFLVAWDDAPAFRPKLFGQRIVPPNVWISAARVTQNGIVVGNEITVAASPDHLANPQIAWQGDRYLVVWEECSHRCDGWVDWSRIRGSYVTTTGQAGSKFLISAKAPEDKYAISFLPSVAVHSTANPPPALVVFADITNDDLIAAYGRRVVNGSPQGNSFRINP